MLAAALDTAKADIRRLRHKATVRDGQLLAAEKRLREELARSRMAETAAAADTATLRAKLEASLAAEASSRAPAATVLVQLAALQSNSEETPALPAASHGTLHNQQEPPAALHSSAAVEAPIICAGTEAPVSKHWCKQQGLAQEQPRQLTEAAN